MPTIPGSDHVSASFLTPSNLGRHVAAAWLLAFGAYALTASTAVPVKLGWLLALAAVGFVCLALDAQARERLAGHRWLVASVCALAAAILLSETLARIFVLSPLHDMPGQPGMLLCLVPLLGLAGERTARIAVLAFAAVCAWHLVAMPVEALTGRNFGWHAAPPFPRESGPFNFQPAGLAGLPFFFPGFFLPLFYLAWGPIVSGRVLPQLAKYRKGLMVLPVLWLLPAAAVQSRSALAGAAAAAALALLGGAGFRRVRTWLIAGLLAAAAAVVYVVLFSENKSDPALRVTYFQHYVRLAFESPWLLTGHGFSPEPQSKLMPPGVQMLMHSHNDIAQVLYCWGLLSLLAYAALWVGLWRDGIRPYLLDVEVWPLCAIVTLVPSLVTDLGLNHTEKTVFLVVFCALCVAVRRSLPRPATA